MATRRENTHLNWSSLRLDFPILGRTVHGKPLVYLDSAATSLKPRVVVEAVSDYLLMGAANVHRGVHYLSEQATDGYERSRRLVKEFINAKDAQEIVFTSGTTMSINLVAHAFGRGTIKQGDEILISHMEHHSNIVPWQLLADEVGCTIKVIPIDDRGDIIWPEFTRMLSSRVKLLAFVYVSNSLGTVNPVKEMIQAAKAHGITVLVDAAQAVQHMKVDVQDLDCDFLAFSGHKMYAPTGVGVLYARAKLLGQMQPFLGGGSMIRSVSFAKTTYADPPERFEAGTPDIAGVIGLGAAIEYLNALGLDNIHHHEEEVLSYATEALREMKGLRLVGEARHRASIISFVLDEIHPHDLGTIVDREGIAIRTGHHCTQPVMTRYRVPATARASFALYNTKADVDSLVAGIRRAQEIFAS